MSYKLTIDKDLMHKVPPPQGIDVLKRWETEGKLALIEAEPSTKGKPTADNEGWFKLNNRADAPPGGAKILRRIPSKVAAVRVTFARMATILFPHRDTQKLNMTEINDVAHMVKHHGSGNELFVTGNSDSFIKGGRRELLKASFGVIAMTPEEAVRMLTEIEGWK
jgi:hypothetical protein